MTKTMDVERYAGWSHAAMNPKQHERGPIAAEHLAGLPGLRLAVRDALIARQPKTVLEALDIAGVGRKTTKHLLAAGIITDPDGVQTGAGAAGRSRGR